MRAPKKFVGDLIKAVIEADSSLLDGLLTPFVRCLALYQYLTADVLGSLAWRLAGVASGVVSMVLDINRTRS